MKRIELFKNHLKQKKAVKVIAGINNFDVESVKKVVSAAEMAQASAVDVAASEEIIYAAKQLTSLPVFVSSTEPQKLAMAVENGADAIEIGNFDALYNKGLRMDAKEILDITKKTMSLVGNDVFVCVTVPGQLDVNEQIKLASKLEEMGVDLIQTEGAAIANVESAGARGLLEKASVSIANTVELARNVEVPVMTASGITTTTAGMAFAAGASAIGVGSCINKLSSTIEMAAVARSLVEIAQKYAQSEDKELALN